MVDSNCKATRVASDNNMPTRSTKPLVSLPPHPARVFAVSPDDTTCSAYEHYLRLPELKEMWENEEFPGWQNEAVLKPAFHALEFTFRFVSIVLPDPRPYANQREWVRRLEALSASQVEVISLFCEADEASKAPVFSIGESERVLTREGGFAEVWKVNDNENATVFVTRVSEESLLPRLATWRKSGHVASKICYSIEYNMMRCSYSLGLGEPNLSGKPSLKYDAVCKPAELHSLTKTPPDHANVDNYENRMLFSTHQILESWVHVALELLKRIELGIESNSFENASADCYVLEKIWKLLAEIVDLHLLMDPDDFLRLKNQLDVKSASESEALCFRSKNLFEITKLSKNLRHKVPSILDVEVDPMGGPIVQEAAIKLYRKKHNAAKIHLLQGLQAVEAAVKKFFYAYKQVLVVVMGSVEAKGNLGLTTMDSCDSLARIFLEPTYFPSLDGAKTFLGDYWRHEENRR